MLKPLKLAHRGSAAGLRQHMRSFRQCVHTQWTREVGNTDILISGRQQQQQQRGMRMSSIHDTLPESTTTEIAGICGPGPFGGRGGGTVYGSVAAGWHDLREAFECNFAKNMELGAQLVVYKNGTVSCV